MSTFVTHSNSSRHAHPPPCSPDDSSWKPAFPRRADHLPSEREAPASTAGRVKLENPGDTATMNIVGMRKANIGKSAQFRKLDPRHWTERGMGKKAHIEICYVL